MKQKIFCLRNIDLYHGITEDELIRLTSDAIEGTFEKNHLFYTPKIPAAHVYIIKSGEVELYREEDGKKIIIETLFPGDVFGDFGTGNTTHYARVQKRCYICCTPTDEFLDVVRSHPEIAFNLMQSLAKKTADYEEKIASFSQPAKSRLLSELQRIEKKNSREIWGKFFKLPLRISHQRLAEQTGLNRVTVTKLMRELQSDKKIKIEDQTNIIKIL